MKKASVSIGLSVVALASVLAACDHNRPPDTMANNRNMKLKVASPSAINITAINQNRADKLKDKSSARIIDVRSSSTGLETMVLDVSKEDQKSEQQIQLALGNCDNVNCEAQITYPGDLGGINALGKIKSLSHDEIVIERSFVEGIKENSNRPSVPVNLSVNDDQTVTRHDQTITIKVEGLDNGVKMKNAKDDDGFNRITLNVVEKLTTVISADSDSSKPKQDPKVIQEVMSQEVVEQRTLIISESVKAQNDDQEFSVASEFLGNLGDVSSLDPKIDERVGGAILKVAQNGSGIPVSAFKSTKAKPMTLPKGSNISLKLGDILAIEEVLK